MRSSGMRRLLSLILGGEGFFWVVLAYGACAWVISVTASPAGGGHFLCGGKESNQRKPLVCASGLVLVATALAMLSWNGNSECSP
jgi:Na+-translocating ferredoxin:NAD+ oxidoreductase RnfD subunit